MKKITFLIAFTLVALSGFAQENTVISELIKKSEAAMGGRKAYEKTKYISWNFFGVRTLTWDKTSGNVRIDFHKENTIYLLNVNSNTGQILKNGEQITQPDSLAKYVDAGRKIWINDMYWLLMPWKLNDPGVNKKYLGNAQTANGNPAEIIELTFNAVGVTPDNKYHIFFDQKTGLVSQWSFFRNYSDEKPMFTMPWQQYTAYGKLLLSGDRGERKISNIQVFEKLDKVVFENFDKPSFLK